MFLTRAFATGDPAKVSVVALSQVVFTLLIDAAITGHGVTPLALTGTLLILAPTMWVMIERRGPRVQQVSDEESLFVPSEESTILADPGG